MQTYRICPKSRTHDHQGNENWESCDCFNTVGCCWAAVVVMSSSFFESRSFFVHPWSFYFLFRKRNNSETIKWIVLKVNYLFHPFSNVQCWETYCATIIPDIIVDLHHEDRSPDAFLKGFILMELFF